MILLRMFDRACNKAQTTTRVYALSCLLLLTHATNF
jgi:hypothetical protein